MVEIRRWIFELGGVLFVFLVNGSFFKEVVSFVRSYVSLLIFGIGKWCIDFGGYLKDKW